MIQGYNDVSGLSMSDVTLNGSSGWGPLLFIDPMGDAGSGGPGTITGAPEMAILDLSGVTINNKEGADSDAFVRGTQSNDSQTGTEGNDVLNAPDEDDNHTDYAGDDTLSGFGGDDTLTGGGGDDKLLGGSGNDVALFGGDREDYTITQNKNGSYTVTDTNTNDGDDGTDTLTGIEGLQFGNDAIIYQIDANSPDYAKSKTIFKETFEDGKASDSFVEDPANPYGHTTLVIQNGNTYAVMTEDTINETGPFTRLGGYSSDFGDGYSVSAKIYLDTEWAEGDGFDVSVAANGKDGSHQRDFIFHVTQDEDTDKLLVGADNNSSFEPKDNLELYNHATIGTSGWYTFDWNFYENDAGNLEVAMNVYDDDGDFVFSEVRSSDQDSIDTEVGGNRYFWFTDISVNGGIQVDDVTMTVPTTGGGTGGGGGDDGDIGGGTTGGEEDDTLAGTDGADTMSGGGGNDEIEGGGGNDTLFSGEGNDTVDGGDGNDLVFGGAGDDVVTGGAGNDQAFGGTGNDNIDGGAGDDFLGGGEGNDTIIGGSGNDALYGGRPGLGGNTNDAFYAGDGDDTGYAGDGDDIAAGGDGADEIGGGIGNDTVGGGNGNDLLYGGAGNDVLYGGNDADTIYGGSGNDQIYFGDNDGAADIYASVADNGTDVVFGFENGTDHLDVRANGFTSFAELTIGEDAGGNATIDLGGGNILTLNGVAASELDASDFLF
ncbi:calcium-binding protein [Afifella aestuarii]|uniref:calcium-binding protein n=1 Tax=Afifella aestuarii TaxID=1909496 RepID=UPI002482373A|nr:calcium-binding protein [Afifella aestuarii]